MGRTGAGKLVMHQAYLDRRRMLTFTKDLLPIDGNISCRSKAKERKENLLGQMGS